MEVIQAIGWLFSASWDFFTEVNVPGFDFSFAALLVGFFLANLGLRFLFMMLGALATFLNTPPIFYLFSLVCFTFVAKFIRILCGGRCKL